MIGLGRRSVPQGISAKISNTINEQSIFVARSIAEFYYIFPLRLGSPAKEMVSRPLKSPSCWFPGAKQRRTFVLSTPKGAEPWAGDGFKNNISGLKMNPALSNLTGYLTG